MTTMLEAPQSDEARLRQDIVWAARLMWERGYVVGTAGNISARVGDTDRLLITPSGAPYDSMKPEDVVLCTLGCKQLAGAGRPSSELLVHTAIYRARPEVRAIVHTHSVYATAIAVNRAEIPLFLDEMYYVIGSSVPTAEYARAGTPELAQSIIRALGDKRAVLMANHGTVAVGADMKEAFSISEAVEKAAMILILAKLYGQVTTIEKSFAQE